MASWEAQADLERAVNDDKSPVITLLDYHKFFDSLEPKLYAKMSGRMG